MGIGIGAILGIFIGIIVLSAIIAGFFMWLGAKLASVEDATFLKAVLAAVAAAIISGVISLVLSVIPVIGTFLGFIVGLIVTIFVIKAVFDTTFGKAFLVWIFNIVAQIIVIIIAFMTFAGAIFTAM